MKDTTVSLRTCTICGAEFQRVPECGCEVTLNYCAACQICGKKVRVSTSRKYHELMPTIDVLMLADNSCRSGKGGGAKSLHSLDLETGCASAHFFSRVRRGWGLGGQARHKTHGN